MTAYALEDARAVLKSTALWLTSEVGMEPLLGIADGTNRVFHVPYTPIDAGSPFKLYDSNGNQITTGFQVLDYDTGVVQFNVGSAPTSTVYASYTVQAINDDRLLQICRRGFNEMQSRYRRALYLVPENGKLYISSDPVAVVDPPCGNRTFSTSEVQIDFLHACCEYALLRALQVDATLRGYVYREERVGGLLVDRSRQPAAFELLLDAADRKVDEKAAAARYEMGDMDDLGSFIPGAKSYALPWNLWPKSG